MSNSTYVKEFMHSFQIFLRQDYNVFLLMTGLYDNIYNLQNNKTLTFLYHAPKIVLEPLNYTAIRKNYQDTFGVDAKTADELALLTKGYSFAFQVLGYLTWKYQDEKNQDQILEMYDEYLADYVYSKIVEELSDCDMDIVRAMIQCDTNKVKEIRDRLQMDSAKFSVYRERLIRKGIIRSNQYGTIDFLLPRFEEYARRNHFQWMEDEDITRIGDEDETKIEDEDGTGIVNKAELQSKEAIVHDIEKIISQLDNAQLSRVLEYVKKCVEIL